MSLFRQAFHDLKVATAQTLCHPKVGRALRFLFQDQLPTRDHVIAFTRSPAVADSTRAMIFWGIFESGERRMIQRHLTGELDTVELGAGIGVISSYIARRLVPGRKLVCVEANPGLVPLIEQNVAINAADTNLQVMGGAVDYSGAAEVSFAVSAADHLGSRVDSTASSTICAPALSLAAVLDRAGITGRYALIADIEGAEHDLVRHDAAALERCDQIIAELHTRNGGTIPGLLAQLDRLGFELVDRHGGVCALVRRSR